MKRFLRIWEAEQKYGPKPSWWRKHIALNTLGNGVARAGRIILLDSWVLEERLARTGQLLVSEAERSLQGNREATSVEQNPCPHPAPRPAPHQAAPNRPHKAVLADATEAGLE
jgi:hypothetical protein